MSVLSYCLTLSLCTNAKDSGNGTDHVRPKFKGATTNGERNTRSTELEQMQCSLALVHIRRDTRDYFPWIGTVSSERWIRTFTGRQRVCIIHAPYIVKWPRWSTLVWNVTIEHLRAIAIGCFIGLWMYFNYIECITVMSAERVSSLLNFVSTPTSVRAPKNRRWRPGRPLMLL